MIKEKISITHTSKNGEEKFLKKNFINYLKYSTKLELMFDIVIPLLISIIVSVIICILIPNPRDYVNVLKEFNSTTITIIAILAGFNTASLTILASTNKELLVDLNSKENSIKNAQPLRGFKALKNLIFNHPSYNALESIISFFTYAVISQLVILIISLIVSLFLGTILNIDNVLPLISKNIKLIILTPFTIVWMTLVLHSIFLSIRNIDMISIFIKFIAKK